MRRLAGSTLALAFCSSSAIAATNSWSTQPLDGGYVGTIHYVRGRNDVALASAGRRIVRTSDDGATWTAIGAVANTSRSVAQGPTNANLVLMISEGHGVMRSDDAGETFRYVGRFSPGSGGERAIAIAADGNAWYGSHYSGGVYRTTDKGQTWEPRSNGLPAQDATVDDIVPDPINASRLYAMVMVHPSQSSTISRHLYVTQDGGGNARSI